MDVNNDTTQLSNDEYDEFNISFDPEFMPYVVDLPPSQDTQDIVLGDGPIGSNVPASPRSTYSDEYSKYDLSEFTAEELATFDQLAFHKPETGAKAHGGTHPGNLSSGPAIEIEIEAHTDVPSAGHTSSEDTSVNVPPLQNLFRSAATNPKSPRPYTTASHYYRFRRWRQTLAVTDLSSPAWCEVQWEYGLLGKRNRDIKDRPASITTPAGKVIHVDKEAARVLDDISKQGSLIHKALEREIHPKKVVIEVATEEEKWGLRILQMIDCVQTLAAVGRCREMPVFGILHGQPVLGIIDEIQRVSVQSPVRSSPSSPSGSNRKREREGIGARASPSKSRPKKLRRSVSPSQPTITAFFNHSPRKNGNDTKVTNSSQDPQPIPGDLPSTPEKYSRLLLRISDTKSRKSGTMPPEVDTEPAQLQLMIYHRLLSCILESSSGSTSASGFGPLWLHLRLSSTRLFSTKFQVQTNLEDVNCLSDVEAMWRRALEMLHVEGVDDSLQIVYRTQVTRERSGTDQRHREDKKGKRKAEGKTPPEVSTEPIGRLSADEEKDILAAIAASLEDIGASQQPQAEATTDLGTHTPPHSDHNVEPGPSGDTNTYAPDDVKSPEAQITSDNTAANNIISADNTQIQAQEHEHPRPKDVPSNELPPQAAPTSNQDSESDADSDSACADVRQQSVILGTKEFTVDNDRLDAYLSSMLELWYGKRRPVGVEAGLTRRCTWCEYHDGCEWREMKAEEARSKPRTASNATPHKV